MASGVDRLRKVVGNDAIKSGTKKVEEQRKKSYVYDSSGNFKGVEEDGKKKSSKKTEEKQNKTTTKQKTTTKSGVNRLREVVGRDAIKSGTQKAEERVKKTYTVPVSHNATKREEEGVTESNLRDATLKDITINSIKQGYYNSRYGQESYYDMIGSENEKQKYEDILAGEDYQFKPNGWLEEAVSGAANLLGQQARQWSDPRALTMAGGAAGAAAIAGQLGPQIAAPEEIITVPAAALAGLQAGSALSNFEIEAGFSYNELIENGISEDTAKKIAVAVGTGNAALELVQMDELAKSFKVLNKTGASKTATSMIIEELAKRGVDVGVETLQELGQEFITIAGTQIGSNIDKGEYAYGTGEVLGRLGDTAISSALSFGLMNVPAATTNISRNIADSKQQIEQEQVTERQTQYAPRPTHTTTLNRTVAENETVDPDGALRQAAAEMVAGQTETSRQAVGAEIGSQTNANPQVGEVSRNARKTVLTEEQKAERAYRNDELYRQAVMSLGDNGVKALGNTYDSKKTDFDTFYAGFSRYYEAGASDLKFELVKTDFARNIAPEVRYAAWTAGQNDRAETLKIERENAKYAKVYGDDAGFVNDISVEVDKQTADVLNTLGKAVGAKIVMKESVFGGQANGSYQNGVISIASDSQNPYLVVAKHEVTHRMQELSPTEYRAYRDYAVRIASRFDEVSEMTLVERYKSMAADNDVNLTTEQAMDEIAADFTEKILRDEKELRDFVGNNDKTVVQKFFDAVREFIDKVKKAFKGNKAQMDRASFEAFGATVAELERAEKLWKDTLKATEQRVKQGAKDSSVTEKTSGNTQYSLKDSKGRELTKEQAEFFKDSKVRDENGNLKVMYHGSERAGFHVFDPSYSDDGISLFFVDSNSVAKSYSGSHEVYTAKTMRGTDDLNKFFAEIGMREYEAVEEDGRFLLMEDGDEVADSDTAAGLYEEFCIWTGVGNGAANYEVYLNLTNPLEVDAGGRNWDNVGREFSQELYDKYQKLTDVQKQALTELSEWGSVGEFRNELREAHKRAQNGGTDDYTKNLATAYSELGGDDINMYDLFSIAENNFSEESLKAFSSVVLKTRDYAKRAKEQGYDGVIFNNIVDVGVYGGSIDTATVAIAFDSNQVKSVANKKPTDHADIRFSLKDSKGRELTEEQQKYFQNSRIRDDAGNLKTVYHGSPAKFTKFSYDFIGSTGSAEGRGFYFTDKKSMAEGYQRDGGQVMEGYLNIEKPLSLTKKTMKRSELTKLLKELDPTGDDIAINYEMSGGVGYPSKAWYTRAINDAVKTIWDGNDNDADILAEIANASGDNESVLKTAKELLGYDGYIADKKYDGASVYVAFSSEQFKNADNQKPTSDPDVRFSLKGMNEIGEVHDKDGNLIAETHENGSAQFSLKTYKDSGRSYLNFWLDKRVQEGKVDRADADDIVRQLDEYYDLCQKFLDKYAPFGAWSNASVVTDNKGKPVFSVVKANGEYAMNLDFSLVCKKRRTLDAVFGEMIRRGVMDNVDLAEADISRVNDIIRESGFETACALCFVDAKRYRQAKVADTFVNQYNDLVRMLIPEGSDVRAHHFDFVGSGVYRDSGRGLHTLTDDELKAGYAKLRQVMKENGSKTVPHKIAKHLLAVKGDRKLVSRSEFMNTDGFGAVKVKNPSVLKLYNSSKGSGGPKAAFSDVQYLGDILQKNNFTPARAYAVGGVRIQSFSDYIPRLVFDYLQMVADLSAKKLPAHAYTKEAIFVKQFGMTGIKMNMSLVPAIAEDGIAPGLDKNGNYYWFDGQSFGSDVKVKGSGQTGFELAIQIQNAPGYSEHCGTIAVGVSDDHIWKMLDDPDIRMIIPYHKSSLNHIVAMLNNIDKYVDYTGVQNTRSKETGKKIDPKKDFNYNKALLNLGDAKAAADEYLAWCEEKGYIPKFDTFAGHENYYKLLEDFSTYDNGVSAPQGAVTMTFPKEGDAFGSMAELIEEGLDEDAVLEGRREKSVPEIVDKVEAALKKTETSYSIKGQSDLLKENARLKEYNDYLKDQMKVTKFAKQDPKSVEKLAKGLLREYGSDLDQAELAEQLNGVYDYMANGTDANGAPAWNELKLKARKVARDILKNVTVQNDELYQAYKGLRDYLRKTSMYISEQDRADLPDEYNDFRRANFGRFVLSNEGTPVDRVYNQLAELYPEFFDADQYTHAADQLAHIVEVLDSLAPVEENPYSYNMNEATEWLANDIVDRFFEIPQKKPTFADKANTKLTKQKIHDADKLARLRDQKNQQIERIRQQSRDRISQAIQKEKAAKWDKVEQVKEKQKQKEARMSDSRKRKAKVQQIVRHVNELSKKLNRPSDKHHVPEELRATVAAMLEAINLESQFTIDPETGKRRKGAEGLPVKRTQEFLKLKEQYAKIVEESGMVVDPSLLGGEGVQGGFDAVIAMSDTLLSDMSMAQLETVWKVLRAVEHSITTADKTLSYAKFQKTSEWAADIYNGTETRKSKKGRFIEKLRVDLENPYTFFSHFGDAGKDIFRMLRQAQDKQQSMVNEVRNEVQKIVSPKQVREFEKQVHEFKTERGDKLTLTTAHVMELYELMKRQQSHDHLLQGGIVQPAIKAKKIKRGNDSVLLTINDISKIVNVLTDEQIAIADGLQKLLTTTLSDYGNEASMKAYGYKKFTGKDYWPIKSAKEGIHSNIEKGAGNTRSIKNIGMAQQVIPHANNALDLGGLFQTFSNHAADMIDYSAWLCPMEDAQRLYNFKFREEDGTQTGKTMKGLLNTVGGAGSEQYWHRLMEDIQNGLSPVNDSAFLEPINKVIGNVKGASVGANIRVIVQQPTAILRAAMVLSPQDMIAGMASGGGWKTALKYSAIAQRKDMGGFDISNPMMMNEILFDSKDKLQRFNEAMMWGAGKADAVTWGRIWNACEHKVKRENPHLSGDSFYKEVDRLFTEVIDSSQVVDGVLQRSQTMRSGNAIMKQATAFMGEPTMAANMLMRAYDAFVNETDGKKRSNARKAFGRTAMVLLVTNAVNALAQSLVDAYRDDEDEEYWDKFWSAFTGLSGDEESLWDKANAAVLSGNLGSSLNPVGYIPVAKDMISILQGYNVTRADADVMGDIMNATKTFMDSAKGDGKKTLAYATKNLAQQVGKVFGVSAPNILRDVWGMARQIAIETDNVELMYEMEKAIYRIDNSGNRGRFIDILYKAQSEGDSATYNHILEDMLNNGIPASKIESGLKSRAKKDDPATEEPEEEEDDKYDIDDLSPKSYIEYTEVKENLYNEITSDFKAHGFEDWDEETKDSLISAALDYVESVALQDASGGMYEEDTKWIGYAQDAEEDLGLTIARYLELREEYGTSALSSEKLYEAADAGIDVEMFLQVKEDTNDLHADKDEDGKSIAGSKKEKVIDYLNSVPGMTEEDYIWFMTEVFRYKL